ncbi:hypothetical protein D1159_03825 [Pseudoflavonifractor sp. 524-17]|uniref:ORF6C domain-containing protein n=1 Tax=Pseudoflavonifractor sp. 524-17 TaxID=2304577 RepID=UPI00137B411D|nr:ORF6C domain-containing protein [Pseudoflavonifractor sp. 524-17]NCE63728.1 hypothetical protein [Pseudoflavonifractor sp. 524-17]
MNDLQIFENPKFGQIRVIERGGEPWFVAADVCRALEISDTWNALQRLDDDEKGTCSISTPGGEQKMNIVNEPGLYSLVLGSRKPEAKAFKRWITHEVIPSIRKTGSYTFDGTSKELQAIFMLDSRTMKHEQRITALEESMVIDYSQQRTLASQVNAVVINALGGADAPAYHDKNVRGRTYSECNRDIQKWFRVNSRNNIPRKRFDEAVEYIQRWRPSTNVSMLIRQTNQQTQLCGGWRSK